VSPTRPTANGPARRQRAPAHLAETALRDLLTPVTSEVVRPCPKPVLHPSFARGQGPASQTQSTKEISDAGANVISTRDQAIRLCPELNLPIPALPAALAQ
jgi:hypothetical protein